MNNPGQLLDSADEPVEYIEKKWLVPLVLCLIAFGYLGSVLKYIVPSGLAFIIMGLFSSFMQYSHHRYYASILALPVIPLTTSFIPFWMPFNDDMVYLLFYSSIVIAPVLSVFFYLYLNRKTKTVSHEPPRHEP